MSDDAENKPPKLRLSRDARPPESEDAGGDATEKKPAAPPSNPDLKLNREKAKDPENAEKPAYDPDDPFGDILPKKPKKPKKSKESKESKPSDGSDRVPPPKLGLDRSKFAARPEETPPKDEDAPPPELPSKPAPRRDDGSGRALDESIKSLPKPSKMQRGFPVASIVIILAMILIIGGAGYGIWYVFAGGSEEPGASTETAGARDDAAANGKAESETEAPAAPGPIEKAKRVVADISTGDLEAVVGEDEAVAPTASETTAAEEVPAEATAAEEVPTEAPVDLSPVPEVPGGDDDATVAPPPPETGPSTALRDEVSGFLSGATIGAVRAGEKARVMLNGSSYSIGDVVDADTGLIFAGTKDQRLVFRDRNGVYYVKSF